MEDEIYVPTPQEADFLLHVKTVLKWVNTCSTQPQILICKEAVDKLVVAKFEQHINEGIDKLIYLDNLVSLNEEIRSRELIIASQTNIKDNAEKLQPSNGRRTTEVY